MTQPFRTGPLNVSFVITSLPVGGAETLLVNLVRRINKSILQPEVLCLKEPGELGDAIALEVPLTGRMLSHKCDLRVMPRLMRAFRRSRADAVITVGAGDKMFGGRLEARMAGVPVVSSALHSTGWPDGIGNNRMNMVTRRGGRITAIGVPNRFGANVITHARQKMWRPK